MLVIDRERKRFVVEWRLSISEENVMHDLAMVGPMTSSIEKIWV